MFYLLSKETRLLLLTFTYVCILGYFTWGHRYFHKTISFNEKQTSISKYYCFSYDWILTFAFLYKLVQVVKVTVCNCASIHCIDISKKAVSRSSFPVHDGIRDACIVFNQEVMIYTFILFDLLNRSVSLRLLSDIGYLTYPSRFKAIEFNTPVYLLAAS